MKTSEEIEKKIISTLEQFEESYAPWEMDEGDCQPYTKENMIEFGKEIYKQAIKEVWDAACKAQMNEVYEHCSHTQDTNGFAIKHWVKTPKIPGEYSDNSEKKYTLADIKNAFKEAREEINYGGMGGWKTKPKWDLDEYIESLNK